MDLKKFYGNITLEINGHENWAFDKVIKFNYHATNFSKVILNNVINKSIISDLFTFYRPSIFKYYRDFFNCNTKE
ncbi:hypothetical protein NWE61_06790 [Mycoplasmopsis felis]|uniref:hypothetical protein n=1 Tax=Mycoplasmopsis felis TaxID=33923 RepID=UPI0021DF4595|nr:hypothetical protein [Mycoplasmopsis felis]MCU9934751.1 hypothetical protein [Mycoplasmopsis felis]